MKATSSLILLMALVIVAESSLLAYPLLRNPATSNVTEKLGPGQTMSFPSYIFNQPLSNDTDRRLNPSYNGSWRLTILSSLVPGERTKGTEAEVALAPYYSSENLSIPTIIVQERADGLLRVEYFEQDWPKTFGLVLYNSTSAGWESGVNLTLTFHSFGPPVGINPKIAPRPNGNLTIKLGDTMILSPFPIAWDSLSELYLYGLPGSAFLSGNVVVTAQQASWG